MFLYLLRETSLSFFSIALYVTSQKLVILSSGFSHCAVYDCVAIAKTLKEQLYRAVHEEIVIF